MVTRPDEPLPDDVDEPRPDDVEEGDDDTVPPFEVDTDKLRVQRDGDE